MHELQHYASAFAMHCIRDLAPPLDLYLSVNAGRAVISLTGRTGLRAFGDYQSGSGALPVVLDHYVGRLVLRTCAVACHGCHDDAVGKLDIAQTGLRKDSAHVSSAP